MFLYNRIDRHLLKEKLKQNRESRITLSFYRYFSIEAPHAYRDKLYAELWAMGILGRVYLALEGINAQLSVPKQNWDAFEKYIDSHADFKGIRLNIAVEDDGQSFIKLVVKVRKKIVADGLEDESFDVTDRGTYLDAQTFNAFAEDPQALIIDMRNHYESEVGRFKGALTSNTDRFKDALLAIEKQLSHKKDKKLVLYCTGGIRCEKASAYYKHKGFKNVFQLEGGIIEYARQVKEKNLENKFIGKNFVFDERLGERISEEIIAHCHQCGAPCDKHINCANDACHLLFIQCDFCRQKYQGCCSKMCIQTIQLPQAEQRKLRKAKKNGMQVYRKGRFPLMKSSQERLFEMKTNF